MVTTPTAVSPGAATGTKRPVGVMVVFALSLVAAAFSFWDAAQILQDAGDDRSELAQGLIQVGLGVLALTVGLGAIGMRSWAWKLFMAYAVVGLTIQILRHFFFDNAYYLGMAINVVAVLALTPRDVQVAFGIKEPPAARLDLPTRNPLDRD